MNNNNSGLCVIVLRFANLSQQSMKPQSDFNRVDRSGTIK